MGTAIFREPDFERLRHSGLRVVGLTVATTWPDVAGSWSRWHFRSLGLPASTVGSALAIAEWQIHRIEDWCAESGGTLRIIRSVGDLDACLADNGPLGILIGVQGGHVLAGEPRNVGRLWTRGVRMLAPAHTMDNDLVGSSTGRRNGGLTDLGREVLDELEALGVIVDLAHMSERGISDALAILSRASIISHTAVRDPTARGSRWRRYSAATRNVSAELAAAVAERGGIVGIVLATQLLGGRTLSHAVAAIRRAIDACGSDHVALGSDVDGALKMVIGHAGLPALADALLGSGLDDDEVRAYLGANSVRFLRDALPRG